ncbi:hypothetical protein [Pimelobacter simplex]|uniref:hypothetical protein n=1 Tax=Nocardioides simplex TaxID=2045 RepID=UPI003AABCDDD
MTPATTPLLLAVLAAPLVALALLTGAGERRRSPRWDVAIVAGAFFPVTWAVWYLRDGRD